MGELKQYECPKCGYKPPMLKFGCGFEDIYEVYSCKKCHIIQSIYIGTWKQAIKPKCQSCGSSDNLEKWDEKHCPKCDEEMVWGVSEEGFFFGNWD